MKFGAEIPLREMPYFHNPGSFPRMEKWQTVAALEAVYKFVKEGKVYPIVPGHRKTALFLPVLRGPKIDTRIVQMDPERILQQRGT